MKPTVKMFVRRLELMINHVEGEECDLVCPGSKKFRVGSYAPPHAHLTYPHVWCITCRTFMADGLSLILQVCPCHHYKKKGMDPIKEALRRIAKYRKENIS
uniref:Uncharacterized protein n=1 Tax=viral metagenome TaxID=1070528 RepID=A0A6M3LJF3_9ZZZZ